MNLRDEILITLPQAKIGRFQIWCVSSLYVVLSYLLRLVCFYESPYFVGSYFEQISKCFKSIYFCRLLERSVNDR